MNTYVPAVVAAALFSATIARAETPLLIGMSVGTLGNPFFVAAAKGALDEARQSDPMRRLQQFRLIMTSTSRPIRSTTLSPPARS